MIGRSEACVEDGTSKRPAQVLLAIVLATLVGASQVLAQAGSSTSPSDQTSGPSSATHSREECLPRSEGGEVELLTVVLADHAVALDVPTSHEVSGSSGQWYVFGHLDGEPLVPDVSLYFVAGASLEDAVETSFPDAAVRTVERDYAGDIYLFTSVSQLSDGTEYTVERYALPVESGIVVAERYEGFDWACFDLVARSMRTFSLP